MKYCPICDQNYPDNCEVCEVDGATLRLKEGKPDALIGKVIKGRYRVLEKLGEGGMGFVYLAEQVAVSRKVALKWLHADYARDEEFVRRFRQEAKLAAALNHRNVVTIFDFDQADDGSLYIVMEYVDGKNLAGVVQEGPIEIDRALRLAVQIADGLMAAHRVGVIHRDVKPENIMVVGHGEEVKIMDFGISRLRDAGGMSRLTRSGTIMGTPAYMAPEQIDGGEVSERTDIYSFGIVLYEMLSGAVPFQARTPGAILVKHLQETAAPLRKVRREIPALVERVVTQALEKDSQRRQSSMQEVADALKQAQRRAESTKTSTARALTDPLARLGLSFGSAAARFKSIFGREPSATSTAPRRATGQSQATPAGAEEAMVLQSHKVLQSDQPAAAPQTALLTDTDSEDKSHPLPDERYKDVVETDASAASAVPEQATAEARIMAAVDPGATVLQSQTILQSEEPAIVPRSVPNASTEVENVPYPSSELSDKAGLTRTEERHRLDQERTLDQIAEINSAPEPQEFPTGAPTVATTVIASAGDTISEMTVLTHAPKIEGAGGFRWKLLSVGAAVAALFAAVIYYQLDDESPRPDVAVVATKSSHVDAEKEETPRVASSPAAGLDVAEPPNVAPEAAPAITATTTTKKPDRQAKEKMIETIKTPVEIKSPPIRTQIESKAQETAAKTGLKDPVKAEAKAPTKEPPQVIASLPPAKPPEAPAAPIVPEPRLVLLSVISDRKELDVNSRVLLTVKGKYSDGKENDIKGSVRWESSDRSVAVVNSRGELEARSEGKAQITASYSGLTSPSYTFLVKGVAQPEKAKSPEEGIQDLRRRLLR